MLYYEKCQNYQVGGPGIECEADASTIGAKNKGGIKCARPSKKRCEVIMLGERKGKIIIIPFLKAQRGSESLLEIIPALDPHLKPKSLLLTDACRGYRSYNLDYPEKEIVLCQISHSESKKGFGFEWNLVLTEDDDLPFEIEDDVRIVPVSTQLCDGTFAHLKSFLKTNGGVQLQHMLWT